MIERIADDVTPERLGAGLRYKLREARTAEALFRLWNDESMAEHRTTMTALQSRQSKRRARDAFISSVALQLGADGFNVTAAGEFLTELMHWTRARERMAT